MITVGSYVIYGANGICMVNDKRCEKLCGTKKEYYVLTPVENRHSLIFIPADNIELLTKVKPLLTGDEILSVIRNTTDSEIQWIDDNKKRAEYFSSVIATGDRNELLKLIKCIYIKKTELAATNKKLWLTDENALKTAEKLINDEFSLVLGIPKNDVPEFIRKNIG